MFWLLARMALEVANQKLDGSRICFPTHLRERQTVSSVTDSLLGTDVMKGISWNRTEEITSSFMSRSLEESGKCRGVTETARQSHTLVFQSHPSQIQVILTQVTRTQPVPLRSWGLRHRAPSWTISPTSGRSPWGPWHGGSGKLLGICRPLCPFPTANCLER